MFNQTVYWNRIEMATLRVGVLYFSGSTKKAGWNFKLSNWEITSGVIQKYQKKTI